MKIVIEGATEAFTEKLIALAAAHDAELAVTAVDSTWTVERAEQYLRSLTAGALRFAKMVITEETGYLDADRLREALGRLNGPTVALSRAVPRGAREGWWPEGMEAPISPVWDPNNPSWHKNTAYRMSTKNLPAFREALARLDASPTRLGWSDEDAPSALEVHPGWTATDESVPRVLLADEPGPTLPDGAEDAPSNTTPRPKRADERELRG